MRRDLGDFQTPPALVAAVLEALGPIGVRWPRVLEPTCGRGEFVAAILGGDVPPREVRGVEIQEAYCDAARGLARGGVDLEVVRADLFRLDLRRDLSWSGEGPLLVVGNPPWVTNATLGILGSDNLPRKSNVKKLRGLDARTGASNFDIAEAVWLKLIDELAGEGPTTIALLCKTSVARNVFAFAARAGWPIAEVSLYRVDARRWFGASVDACLFCVTLGAGGPPPSVPVFADLGATVPESEMGLVDGRLVADLAAYRRFAFADGRSPLTWRQGVKHDVASVMELVRDPATGILYNKRGGAVDVEDAWVYPLIKGTDLMAWPSARPARAVIVTQRKIGEDTGRLERAAPRLWGYLGAHAGEFAARKSSIYRSQSPFAMFGLGPYSFAPYKVAVAGLSKSPRFVAIGPVGGRPVMLDDTCYFLACGSAGQAALASALLNDPATLGLIHSLIFRDAKRPITKALLQRLDLSALEAHADPLALRARAAEELERLERRCDADHGDSTDAASPPVLAVTEPHFGQVDRAGTRG